MIIGNSTLYRGFKCFEKRVVFKHIRFKSCASTQMLPMDACKHRNQNLAKMLNCSIFTARDITTKNKNILALEYQDFNRNVNFCKDYFTLWEIIECPFIVSLNSSLLQHRYFSLKELGCANVSASYILKFPNILKKTPKSLQNEGILFAYEHRSSVLDKFLDNSEINSKLQSMYDDGSSLRKIKETMNAEFLATTLGCSIGKAHQMFHGYPPLGVQSIVNTNKLLKVLFQKLGFSVSKICNSLNLLSLHHETVEYFLTEIPEILGVKMENLVHKLPVILKRSINDMQTIEGILKDFNISDAQLMCCPKVLSFTPNSIKERLTSLCNSEDFALLKYYKKFLWLVYYFNDLNYRLESLKAMDIPCSINMFTVSKSNFSKYLCINKCQTRVHDLYNNECTYLASIFSMNGKDILARLREYPNYKNSSLNNCCSVVEFLLKSGVTKKQILNGLGIIFYNIEIVEVYFEDLKDHPECQPFEEWVHHYNLIQLLIYTIEVDNGFQGSRLYKTKRKVDEQEELVSHYC